MKNKKHYIEIIELIAAGVFIITLFFLIRYFLGIGKHAPSKPMTREEISQALSALGTPTPYTAKEQKALFDKLEKLSVPATTTSTSTKTAEPKVDTDALMKKLKALNN